MIGRYTRLTTYISFVVYPCFLAWLIFAFHQTLPAFTLPALAEIYRSCRDFIVNAGLLDLFLIAWFFLIAYGMGRKIFSYLVFQFATEAEALVFSSSLGCALLSFFTFALSLLGLLYSSAFYGVFLVLTIVCATDIRNLFHILRKGIINGVRALDLSSKGLLHLFIGSYLAILILIALIAALGPEIEYDALNYHLLGPKVYIEQHKLVSISHTPETFFPKNLEMLFVVGMLLHNDISAKLMHLLFGLLLCLALYVCGRRFFSSVAGLIAAAIFFSSPIVLWEMKSAHIDVGLAHYVFLALYAFLVFTQNDDQRWLKLSAALTGFSLGIKYHGLFCLASLASIIVGYFILVKHRPIRQSVRAGLQFVWLSSLVFLPWVLTNAFQTGDPLFPLLNKFFPSPYWDDRQASEHFEFFRDVGYSLTLSNWHNIANTLWGVFTDQSNKFDGHIGLFYLLLAPLIVMMPTRDRAANLTLLFSSLYILFWLCTLQISRYVIPALPGLSLIEANLLVRFLKDDRPYRKLLAYLTIPPLGLIALLTLPFFERYNGGARHGNPLLETLPLKVVSGMESREDYLSRWIRGYRVVKRCNDLPDVNKVLFTWRPYGDAAYYMKRARAVVRWPFLSPTAETSPEQIYRRLKDDSVTHLVAYQETQRLQPITDPEGEFVKKYLQKLYQKDGAVLYRVSPEAKEPEEEELVFSFIDHLGESRMALDGQMTTLNTGVYDINREQHYAIWVSPPSQIEFALTLPVKPVLKFFLGKPHPECGEGGSGQILIVDEGGNTQKVYSRYVNPRDNHHDCGWLSEQIDLADFARRKTKIIFKTDGGQADILCNGFLWGDIELYSRR